jgi:hypothetical protein
MHRLIGALIVLTFVAAAHAEEGQLVERVPAGAEPAVVLAVVKAALINRKWTVQAEGLDFVEATLSPRPNVHVRMRVTLNGRALTYEGESRQRATSVNPNQSGTFAPSAGVPKRWIAYLKRDISLTLATIPDRAP